MCNTKSQTSTSLRPWPQHRPAFLRRLEGGSAEGGGFAQIAYMPFLIALLMIGLIFGMVGFWRVGASYSVQYGAQVGSVAPAEGADVLNALWRGWMNNGQITGEFAVNDAERSVRASAEAEKAFEYQRFGLWNFEISAGGDLHIRSERFYPGAPMCDEEGCDE